MPVVGWGVPLAETLRSAEDSGSEAELSVKASDCDLSARNVNGEHLGTLNSPPVLNPVD